jgi:hypothetical protein
MKLLPVEPLQMSFPGAGAEPEAGPPKRADEEQIDN